MLPGDAWGPLNGRCAKPSFNSSYVLRGGVVGPEPPGAPHAPIQQQLAWTGESTRLSAAVDIQRLSFVGLS